MDTKKERKWFLPALAAFCALTAAACHTVEGAGRDVSAAGGAVSDAAREATPPPAH